VVAVGAIITTALLNEATLAGVSSSSEWVSQTLRVQAGVQSVLTTVTDAETGQRGYLLTGDLSYLAPYEDARGKISSGITALRRQITDQPRQRRNLDVLEQLAGEKMRELESTIDLGVAGRRDDAQRIVNSGRGRALMARIRMLARAANFEQSRLLQERELN